MAELLTNSNPLGFFQVGQQMAGQSGLNTFVSQLTERAKNLDLANLKVQTEVAVDNAKMQNDPFSKFMFGQTQEQPPSNVTAESPNAVASPQLSGQNPVSPSQPSPASAMDKFKSFQQQLPYGVTYKSPSGAWNVTNPMPSATIQQDRNQATAQGVTANYLTQLALDANKELGSTGAFGKMGATFASNLTGGEHSPALRQYLQALDSDAVGIYKYLTLDKQVNNLDAEIRAKARMWRPDQGEPWEPIGRTKMERLNRAFQMREQMNQQGQMVPMSMEQLGLIDSGSNGEPTLEEIDAALAAQGGSNG